MYLHPSMSHANSFFLAAVLLCLYLGGDGVGRWSLMGLVAGLMMLVRYQDVALLAGLAVGEMWQGAREWRVGQPLGVLVRGRVIRYVLFAVVAVAAFSPQLAAWKILQGGWFSGPRAYLDQGRLSFVAPVHTLDALFSPRHGLFYWHPALLLAIAGFFARPGDQREKAICLGAFAAAAWVVGSWSIWWAGASFGQRMFISTLPFLAFGAGPAMAAWGRARIPWPQAVVLLAALWNFGLVVQYGSAMISRKDGVGFTEMARNNFVEVPRTLLRLGAPRKTP